jgi:hypothetical protein
MVKDHARKKQTSAAAEAAGLSYAQTVSSLRRRDEVGGSLLVVDYPAPDLRGVAPCPGCAGSGMSGELFEEPGDGSRPPLQVGAVCSRCLGCGRAEHDECTPGEHATDDSDEVAEYLYELDPDGEQGPACPSCHGLRFWHMTAWSTDDDGAAAEARAQLLERARAAGVSDWDVDFAAQLGELDELLGDGAQALAQGADTTLYLRMPCGCAADLVRTVPR